MESTSSPWPLGSQELPTPLNSSHTTLSVAYSASYLSKVVHAQGLGAVCSLGLNTLSPDFLHTAGSFRSQRKCYHLRKTCVAILSVGRGKQEERNSITSRETMSEEKKSRSHKPKSWHFDKNMINEQTFERSNRQFYKYSTRSYF